MSDPVICTDCTQIANGQAIAIRYCPRHKNESVERIAEARAANPDIDALHRMLAVVRR